eukprot:RCo042701
MGEEEAVKVAVRMRCFNQREKDAEAVRIVRMEKLAVGSRTYVQDPASASKDEKKFDLDHSFQTFSREDLEAGEYYDQDRVFDEVGRPLMATALEGRNVSLFAYGQTGAGKSFSMLGKPDQPGIIPRICKAIFQEVQDAKSKGPPRADLSVDYMVQVQVVEIYCEMIHDLLTDRKTWPPKGLQTRKTPDNGYVVDALGRPCTQYSEIEEAIKMADQNRAVGSHALNPESSRAHTIYTIIYEKKTIQTATQKVTEQVRARLNLIDLAGSERCDKAGTSGQMLQEGIAINMSLTHLGDCIKALSESKKPNFRNSKLTLLLEGSMTNGKLMMIAAVSPASICYEETISTLRFAERIKKVKIKCRKNITKNPVEELKNEMEQRRLEMQQEIDELKKRVAGGGVVGGGGDSEAVDKLKEMLKLQEEEAQQMREALDFRMRELQETPSEREARSKEIADAHRKALGGASIKNPDEITLPHLRNLNADLRLADTLIYEIERGDTVIGRMDPENPPKFEFNGMGMQPNHCKMMFDGRRVYLRKEAEHARVLVNGRPVEEDTELKHHYRLWLGGNYAFRFVFPNREKEGDPQFEGKDPPYPTFAFAEEEMCKAAVDQESAGHGSSLSKDLLLKLNDALRGCEKANQVARDLTRNVEFTAKIFKNRITDEADVCVVVREGPSEWQWFMDKFQTRLDSFAQEWENWDRCRQSGEKYQPPAEDPFTDNEDLLIGEADVWLQSLAHMMEFECSAPVVSTTGKVEGQVHVQLMPLGKNGSKGPWQPGDVNDPFVDEPEELVGKTIQVEVRIMEVIFDAQPDSQTVAPPPGAEGEQEGNLCPFHHVFLRYKLNPKDQSIPWSQVPVCKESTMNPTFNYTEVHELVVTHELLTNLKEGKLLIQVWGLSSAVQPNIEAQEVSDDEDAKLDEMLAERQQKLAKLDREIAEARRKLVHLL